jgi:hypothetical protein
VLNVDLILDLHAILQENKKDHVLGDELPYQSLALFLGFSHNRAAPGWDTSALREVVVAILNVVKIVKKHHPFPSMQTPSEEPDESAGHVAFILFCDRRCASLRNTCWTRRNRYVNSTVESKSICRSMT